VQLPSARALFAVLTLHTPVCFFSQNLLMYLSDEARDKTPQALFHAPECRCEVVRDAPVQTTDCDCAVLVCVIAEHLSAGRAATLSQDIVSDMHCCMLLAFSSTTSSEQAKRPGAVVVRSLPHRSTRHEVHENKMNCVFSRSLVHACSATQDFPQRLPCSFCVAIRIPQ